MSWKAHSGAFMIILRIAIIFSLMWFAVPTTSLAQAIEISAPLHGLPIGDKLRLYEDRGKSLTLDEVKKLPDTAFQPATEPIPNLGFNESAIWVRFELVNPLDRPRPIIIEHDYATVDTLDLFIPMPDGSFRQSQAGDQRRLSDKELKYRLAAFPVELPPGRHVFYLRAQTEGVCRFPILLWDPEHFADKRLTENAFLGIAYGFLIVMAFYNLFLAVSFRSTTYVLYVAFIVTAASLQMAFQGLWTVFVDEDIGIWLSQLGLLFSAAAATFMVTCFTIRFLGLRHNAPILAQALQFIAAVSLGVPLVAVLSYNLGGKLVNILVFLTTFLIFAGCVICCRKRYRPAYFFTAAWLTTLLSYMIHPLALAGLVPVNVIATWGPFAGLCVEVVLISLALGDKMRQGQESALAREIESQRVIRELNLTLEASLNLEKLAHDRARHAKERLEKLSKNLEEKIAEKTAALRDQNIHLEEQKKQLEAAHTDLKDLDERKTEFFRHISHELRTPLTLILNPLQQLKAAYAEDKRFQLAWNNAVRLLHLVNQLLDFQRVSFARSRAQLSRVDISSTLQACLEPFATSCARKQITVENRAAEASQLYSMAHIASFETIISNYLSNAYKHTPEHGTITVALHATPDSLRVEVTNTGKGIPRSAQAKLFKLFTQLDDDTNALYAGSGIGLYLAERLASEMHAKVGVESDGKELATFWLELKRANDPGACCDILVVEDDLAIRNDFIKAASELPDINVIVVADKAGFLETLETHEIRCIISDGYLPDCDGLSLLQMIADQQAQAMRYMITGIENSQFLDEVINSGTVKQIFRKPIQASKVLTELVSLLPAQAAPDTEKTPRPWTEPSELQRSSGSAPQTLAGKYPEGGREKILIVDDIQDMRDLIRDILRGQGFEIEEARNGQDGIDRALRIKPDLILCDWMMNDMDGPTMLKAIRQQEALAATPFIMMTAKADQDSRSQSTAIGAQGFISKPFDELELVATIENLLELKKKEKHLENLNREIIENVLSRFLPPALVDDIVAGRRTFDETPHLETITVMFIDLCNFTAESHKLGPTKTAQVLNSYLEAMTEIIFAHRGTVDKFIGDGIMVLFGSPVPMDPRDQARLAVECAQEMQMKMQTLASSWSMLGLPSLQMRIGIHNGPCIVGNFGSKKRSDFTAIGTTVNIASRIETVTPPGEIMISSTMRDYLPEDCWNEAGVHKLKGVRTEVELYSIKPKNLAKAS
jgi:class 3 adenylate cyclase/signal transduction histidine kinase/CheY-like chemotaxis protein